MTLADWEKRGFAEPPRYCVATGREIIYRVGGGPLNLPLGSFFSPLKVDSVSQAELSFNIVDWGNRCYYVATYRVCPGTEMWIGRVAHGRKDIADRSAVQVFIEGPIGRVVLQRDVEPLKQDLFVGPRAGHA